MTPRLPPGSRRSEQATRDGSLRRVEHAAEAARVRIAGIQTRVAQVRLRAAAHSAEMTRRQAANRAEKQGR